MTVVGEENLYAVLEVESTASHTEILAAFRKKARKLHPDVNPSDNAEEAFRNLRAAYDVLRDAQKRSAYDAKLGRSSRSTHHRNPPKDDSGRAGSPKGGSDKSGGQAADTTGTEQRTRGRRHNQRSKRGFADDLDFEDIRVGVEDLHRHRRSKRRASAPESDPGQEIELSIPLDAAYTGTTLGVTLERPRESVREKSTFKLRIPVGAKEGDRLKLEDPDVLVVLRFKPHPGFEVEGRDVTTDLELLPWDAALGATLDVPKPAGSVKVRIPEGSSTGQRLRLKGQGIPAKAGKQGEPGDLYIRIKVVMPAALTDEQRALFAELRRVSKHDSGSTGDPREHKHR